MTGGLIMHSTPQLVNSRLRSESGIATLLSTLAIMMFCLVFFFYVLAPLIWTPQIRDAAQRSTDSWTALYAKRGSNEIPPYSMEYRHGAPAEHNTITFRLREELEGNRFISSVDHVICGRVEPAPIRPRLVPENQHAPGTLVTCGIEVKNSGTQWRTPGFLDRIFGDFWYRAMPKPVRSVR